MNAPAVYVWMGLFGAIAGVLSGRLRVSGRIALILPVIGGAALILALASGRR